MNKIKRVYENGVLKGRIFTAQNKSFSIVFDFNGTYSLYCNGVFIKHFDNYRSVKQFSDNIINNKTII